MVNVDRLHGAAGQAIAGSELLEGAIPESHEEPIPVSDPDGAIAVLRKRRSHTRSWNREVLKPFRYAVPTAESVVAQWADTRDPDAALTILEHSKNILRAQAVAHRVNCRRCG